MARASPGVEGAMLQIVPESLRKIGETRVPSSVGDSFSLDEKISRASRVVGVRDLARPSLALIVALIVRAADEAVLSTLLRLAVPAHLLN